MLCAVEISLDLGEKSRLKIHFLQSLVSLLHLLDVSLLELIQVRLQRFEVSQSPKSHALVLIYIAHYTVDLSEVELIQVRLIGRQLIEELAKSNLICNSDALVNYVGVEGMHQHQRYDLLVRRYELSHERKQLLKCFCRITWRMLLLDLLTIYLLNHLHDCWPQVLHFDGVVDVEVQHLLLRTG